MNSFFVDDQEIFLFADVSHLIKSLRNAVLEQSLKGFSLMLSLETMSKYHLPTQNIDFNAFKDLVEYQSSQVGDWKIAPGLTFKCIKLDHFEKMKVGPAKTLLSREVAVGIRYMIKHANAPAHYETTAFFCEKVGKWFDLMSSRSISLSLGYQNEEKFDTTVEELIEFMHIIDGMKLSAKHQNGRKPVQHGILLSTTSLIQVAKYLLDEANYQFVFPGRFLGDCIENVNSQIRRVVSNPTSKMMKYCMKIVVFVSYLKPSKHGSYDIDDSSNWLTELQDLKDLERSHFPAESVQDESEFIITAKYIKDHPQDTARAYCNGYTLMVTICTKSYCAVCKNMWTGSDANLEDHELIAARRYSPDAALVVPSLMAIEIFNICDSTFDSNQEVLRTSGNVNQLAEEMEKFVLDKFAVPKCHLGLILRRWFKVRMFIHASRLNEQMKESLATRIKGSANASKTAKKKHT